MLNILTKNLNKLNLNKNLGPGLGVLSNLSIKRFSTENNNSSSTQVKTKSIYKSILPKPTSSQAQGIKKSPPRKFSQEKKEDLFDENLKKGMDEYIQKMVSKLSLTIYSN